MKKTTILVVVALLAVPLAFALSTQTLVHFNVPTVIAYTLTLPGESAVNAGAGTATADIEFNSTDGSDLDVNPRVVGGTAQSDGTPIFQFDNTGTVNIDLSVVFDTALPTCITVTGANTYAGAGSGANIGTTNVTVVSNFAPGAGTYDWYMKADFVGCVASDTTTRTLRSYGIQS